MRTGPISTSDWSSKFSMRPISTWTMDDVDRRDARLYRDAWLGGDPRADFDGDGHVEWDDVLGFRDAWRDGQEERPAVANRRPPAGP